MTESCIEQLAEQVLLAHDLTSLPVDPLTIAQLENILLVPGRYDGCFDGRIEFRQDDDEGRFYLFYAEAESPERPGSRVRFSVAHELGHFFLPTHREYLTSGEWLGSQRPFVFNKRMERQANSFAAALLMPRQAFIEQVQSRVKDFCTLQDLVHLADHVFDTSITSAAIRFVHLNFEACCVVLSEKSQVLYSVWSDEMRRRGWHWIHAIPATSVTGRWTAAPGPGETRIAQQWVDAALWFEGQEGPLWEQALVRGETGRLLTYLMLPGNPENGGV